MVYYVIINSFGRMWRVARFSIFLRFCCQLQWFLSSEDSFFVLIQLGLKRSVRCVDCKNHKLFSQILKKSDFYSTFICKIWISIRAVGVIFVWITKMRSKKRRRSGGKIFFLPKWRPFISWKKIYKKSKIQRLVTFDQTSL